MIATPLSDRPYFPALLGNGRSSILIDYAGANFNGRNGHSHDEQNQNALCGWYKSTRMAKTGGKQVQPVIRGGVQVNLYRAAAEPQWYEQELVAQTASVVNRMRYAGGLELRIENFLTDDEIWCQEISVIHCPEGLEADVGFAISKATGGMLQDAEYEICENTDVLHRFRYRCGPVWGGGILWAEVPYDVTEADGGLYRNVKTGQRFRRLLCCLDISDGEDWKIRLDALQQKGNWSYEQLWKSNCAAWQNRYGNCRLELPDDNIQQLYELSRYVLHICQHPDYGGITTGTLPYLWGGGIHCPYDAQQGHMALLSSGNIQAGRRYVDYYLHAAKINKRIMLEQGVPGVTIAGWDDCRGEPLVDLVSYVTEHKPQNAAHAVTAIYHQWRFSGMALTEEEITFIRDVVTYYYAAVIRRKNGKVFLAPVSAGTEGGFQVTMDTFVQLSIGYALVQSGEMLGDESLKADGEQLLDDLEQNRVNGILMPFDGAFYTGGIGIFACTQDIPHRVIKAVDIDACLHRGKTHWGYNLEQSTEEYRHWPWIESYAAIGYARRGEPEKAMECLLHMDRVTSSLGVLPEKVRLDGYVIGYWYMTPHALTVLAIQDAIAHSDRPGEMCLLQGVTTRWQHFRGENIAQPDGLRVSLEVKQGKLQSLTIRNWKNKPQKLDLRINPAFRGEFLKDVVEIPANGEFCWCNCSKSL